MINKIESWSITCDRLIAYIDIMGFKDMVARENHSKIYELMQTIHSSIENNLKINWIKKIIDNDKYIYITMYSDSIIIYSKDSTYESCYSFTCAVSSLISDLFITGIPHKGAVAFGQITLDIEKSIFFGQPLIDSFLLQESINYYGVVLHSSAEQFYYQFVPSDHTVPFVISALSYFKGGNSIHKTIYPMYTEVYLPPEHEHYLASIKKQKQLCEAINNFNFRTSGPLRIYIDNTKSYLKQINKKLF